MNILSQKETSSICGGGFLNNLAKKAQEEAQKITNEAIAIAAKKAQKEVNRLKIV